MAGSRKAQWSGTVAPPEPPDEPIPAPADLSAPVDLEDTEVTDVDWTGARAFSLIIERTRLERCRLTSSDIEQVRLLDVALVDCELSGAVLQRLRATRVELIGCRMSGLVITEAQLHDVRFHRCRMDDAAFHVEDARHVVFDECELPGADLTRVSMGDARFDACDLSRADLRGARLERIRIRGGHVDGLRGAPALRGSSVSDDLVLPLSMALFADSGITLDRTDG